MFSQVDWVGVVLAALAAFGVGSIWFAPPVFGNRWGRAIKSWTRLTDRDLRPVPLLMVAWLVGAFANAVAIDVLLDLARAYTAKEGLTIGAFIGVGIGVPLTAWPVLFARQPRTIWLLNAGAFILMQLAIGTILGARAA